MTINVKQAPFRADNLWSPGKHLETKKITQNRRQDSNQQDIPVPEGVIALSVHAQSPGNNEYCIRITDVQNSNWDDANGDAINPFADPPSGQEAGPPTIGCCIYHEGTDGVQPMLGARYGMFYNTKQNSTNHNNMYVSEYTE